MMHENTTLQTLELMHHKRKKSQNRSNPHLHISQTYSKAIQRFSSTVQENNNMGLFNDANAFK